MGYVVAGIVLLLLISGFITFLVMNAAKRGHPARTDGTAGDGADDAAPGIGADASPLGDTHEHAGEQDDAGQTVSANDAAQAGGTGSPAFGAQGVDQPDAPQGPPEGRRFQRDPIGGEAEARPYGEPGTEQRP